MAEITATVTEIGYQDTVEAPTVTPLGVERTVTIELDNLAAVFSVGPVEDHGYVCRPEAVGNRLYVYGLTDPQDALDALIREVVFHWSGLDPETDDQAGRLGGIDSRIAIAWGAEAKPAATGLLERFAERIAAKRATYD
jgi:hypothetical protein